MVWRGTALFTILPMAISLTGLQEYRFVVTAKDGASDPRIATATVPGEVVDVEDELPIFHLTSYEAQVPENMPDYMVTQVKV
jgi:protocadherin-15